ncbi:hypothetical protein ABT346_26855 [Micromonospora peucetia]|uniref:hypothetical protein n=1 Tax=Micromonospora peucetia TaxID=47871 RepID=UPI00331DEE74
MANKCPVHGPQKLMDDDYFATPYAAYERYAALHEQGTVHRTCLDDHGRMWLVGDYPAIPPITMSGSGRTRTCSTRPSRSCCAATALVSLLVTI